MSSNNYKLLPADCRFLDSGHTCINRIKNLVLHSNITNISKSFLAIKLFVIMVFTKYSSVISISNFNQWPSSIQEFRIISGFLACYNSYTGSRTNKVFYHLFCTLLYIYTIYTITSHNTILRISHGLYPEEICTLYSNLMCLELSFSMHLNT